jgi:4-amino-4-deoxy-L-arabinose transferase-like glycosyltransferase
VNLGAFEATIMEARNFESAREMITDGNWWETTMNGKPRLKKPPLPTWITATFGLFNKDMPNWLLRIPSGLMGLLMVYWSYILASILFESKPKAFWCAFILATSVMTIQMARRGSWDIYYVSFGLGACTYLLKGLRINSNEWVHFIYFGLLLGASLLSKGPVALIVIITFIICLRLAYGKGLLTNKWKFFLAALFIGHVIGFTWYAYNIIYQADALAIAADQESISWTTRHLKPFYFYISFPVFIGVWTIPSLISFIPRIGKRALNSKYIPLVIWVLSHVIILSLFPMKKERYLLLVMPSLSILTGAVIHEILNWENTKLKRKLLLASLIPPAIGFIGIPAFLTIIYLQQEFPMTSMSWAGAIISALIGFYVLFQLKSKMYRGAILTIGAAVCSFCIFLMPSIAYYSFKLKEYTSPYKLANNEIVNNRKIYTFGEPDLRAVWELRKKTIDFDKVTLQKEDFPIYMITNDDSIKMKNRMRRYNVTFLDSANYYRKNMGVRFYSYEVDLK